MKSFKLKMALLAALLFLGVKVGYANEPTAVAQAVADMAAKYENTEGVDCMVVTKGNGLGMVKMALKAQLGKSFLKGVTAMTIIDYSKGSAEVCESIKADANIFLSMLEEIDLTRGEKKIDDSSYLRCFAAVNENRTISDFVMLMENKEMKWMIYMEGEIKVEE